MKSNVLGLAIACLGLSAAAQANAEPAQRPFGDVQLLTQIPASPGFPEGIAVEDRTAYVIGPAAFGTAGKPASTLRTLNTRTGALVDEFALLGEDLSLEHAASAVALDRRERLYILGTQIGVVRVDLRQRTQESYAGLLPDIPPCGPSVPEPCSKTSIDRPPFPNDIVFDEAGNLYISDSFQASIFRVEAGGGAPELWLSSPELDGAFGINGLRFSPDRDELAFTNTDPVQGGVYSIAVRPRRGDLVPGAISLVHAFPNDGPDGFAFGRSGKIYVSLAFSSQVAVLDRGGQEIARFSDPRFSNPSGLAFDDRGSLLVVNHAIFDPNPKDKFAIYDIWVDDRGDRLETPRIR